MAGTTKRWKQTRQLTGFPGNPKARIFPDAILSAGFELISANVKGFPGFMQTWR
jgi:hypothetical protein